MKPKQYVKDVIYEVRSPSDLKERLKYVDRFTYGRDTFRVFRHLRPKSKKTGGNG